MPSPGSTVMLSFIAPRESKSKSLFFDGASQPGAKRPQNSRAAAGLCPLKALRKYLRGEEGERSAHIGFYIAASAQVIYLNPFFVAAPDLWDPDVYVESEFPERAM